MDEKYDVYVVVLPATERAFSQLSEVIDTIYDITQGVDYELAQAAAETVDRLWREVPDASI